jgi:hypothetical protein
MTSDAKTLTREELYDHVWSTPMRTLAKTFGLSDVGLAKTCKRMKVPYPGRGYWAKKAAGKGVKKPPLPALPPNISGVPREVRFAPARTNVQEPPPTPAPVLEQEDYESHPDNRITVRETLRSPHPLIQHARRVLSASTGTADEIVGSWREQHVDIRVSRGMLNRALRVMDALIKAFERRGWKVWVGTNDDRKTYVGVLGRQVPFGLREKIKKVENPPPKAVRLRSGEWYTPYQSKYRDTPSDKLALVLRNRWSDSVDESWEDSPDLPVEDQLNDFVVAVVARAHYDLEWDRRRDEAERARAAEQQRRFEEAQRREVEAARGRELERQAENWMKSRQIKTFLAAVKESASEASEIDLYTPLGEWLSWAETYANRLDPFKNELEQLLASNKRSGSHRMD